MSVSNRSDFMDEPHIGESDLRRLVKRVINEDVSCKCMQMLITRYLNADGSCCEREEVSYSFVDCPCSGAGSGADAGAGPLTHPHAETAGRGKARELPPKIVNVEKNQYRITEEKKFTCFECRPGGWFGRGKCHHSASYLGTSRPDDCISWEECLEDCEGKSINYGKVIDTPTSISGVSSMGENKLKEAIRKEIRKTLNEKQLGEAKKLSEDRATQAAAKKDRLEKHKKMKDYEDSGKEFTDIDDTEPTKAQIKGIDKSIGDAKEALAQAIKKVKDLGPDIKKLAKETNEKIKKNPAGKADYLKTYTTNPDVKAFIKLRKMLKSADLL